MMTFNEFSKSRTDKKFVLSEETQHKINENTNKRLQQMQEYNRRRELHRKIINDIKSR